MAQNEIAFVGNADGLLKEYDRLEQAQHKQEQAIAKTAKTAKEAAREDAKAQRDAERYRQKAMTDQEKYEANEKHLIDLKKRGKLTEDEFNRALANEKEIRDRNIDSTKQGESAIARYNRRLAEYNRQLKTGELGVEQHRQKTAAATREYRSAATGLDKWGGAAGAVTMAGTAMVGMLTQVIAKNKEVQESIEDTIVSLDDLETKFAVQAGLNANQSREARRNILETAADNNSTADTAFRASTQLVSSGFSVEEAQGDALDIFLKAQQSSNLAGQSPEDTLQAASKFMSGYGMEKNAANLGDLMVRMRGLFAGKDVQVSDLSEFAKAAPVASKADISLEDTLSSLTLLREQVSAGEASTQFRNVVQNFQGAGASKNKVDALAEIGLKPEDIDLVDESLDEVFARLNKGLESVDKSKQNIVLEKLVEKANVGALTTLLGGKEQMDEFDVMQQDRAGFVQGVKTTQGSIRARTNRLDVLDQIDMLDEEEVAEQRILEKRQLERIDKMNFKSGGIFNTAGTMAGNAVRDTFIGLGVDRKNFMSNQAVQQIEQSGQSNFSEAKLDQLIALSQQQVGIQEKQVQATERNKPQKQNPQLQNDRRMRGM